MRVVDEPDMLEHAYGTAQEEARSAFGNPELYLERYLQQPKHVESRFSAMAMVGVIHFFDRECSIQRRYQKILEEADEFAPARNQTGDRRGSRPVGGPYRLSRRRDLRIPGRSGRFLLL